jgi:predicted enzyme related to lactoylglutathione lyase
MPTQRGGSRPPFASSARNWRDFPPFSDFILRMEISTYKTGSCCTAVLRTRNIERAENFYSALVGWTTQETPDAPSHRFLQWRGKTVASVHQVSDGIDAWVPHISVENIEAATANAESLGAKVVDAADLPSVARIATICDPEGAVFGLWQPAPHQGAEITEDVGSLWWIEVLSNNVAGARDFYQRLFGWNSVDTSFEPFATYTVFKRGDEQEAGLLPIGHDWGVPPRWNAIFSLDACDAVIERATAIGGRSLFVHTVPTAGRIGSLSDSGGAVFVIRGPVP